MLRGEVMRAPNCVVRTQGKPLEEGMGSAQTENLKGNWEEDLREIEAVQSP